MDDAAAAVNLVGSVLRLVPVFKNASRHVSIPGTKATGGGRTGPTPFTTTAVPPVPPRVDAERERRAYETVNYVLRTLGVRLGEAGLVSPPALAKALTEATQSIDVKLFSIQTNRLFESLAAKLNDPILVNSVFSSIYLIAFLTAELQGSLPNYKDTYAPLGPRLCQQLFISAIGQDAFRENQTANLDAYQTLARTAGLLRPTDLERATFPGLPSFRPSRYSSKTFKDTHKHRSAYERLVKHFEQYGFPQPLKGRDVGEIRDWRFLSGDSNTRTFEVEKTDKHIGENFGRVLHWLMCSADRMPPGEAVIAYLDQHIELIKWLGPRMGYCVIYPGTDLDLGGPHAMLKKDLRDIVDTWVILMSSESCKANRRMSSTHWAQWTQSQHRSQPAISISPKNATNPVVKRKPSVGTPISPVGSSFSSVSNTQAASISSLPANGGDSSTPQPIDRSISPPQKAPLPKPKITAQASPTPISRQSSNVSTTTQNASSPNPPQDVSPIASDISQSPSPLQRLSPISSPPPYSPYNGVNDAVTVDAYSFPATPGPTSAVRRKAPPRPKKKPVFALALDDFKPEDDEELPFKEGDFLEIVEKSVVLEQEGWCRARLKYGQRVGLAPLEYLDILPPDAQESHDTQLSGPGQETSSSITTTVTTPPAETESNSHTPNPSATTQHSTFNLPVHSILPPAHIRPPQSSIPQTGSDHPPSGSSLQISMPQNPTLRPSQAHLGQTSQSSLGAISLSNAAQNVDSPTTITTYQSSTPPVNASGVRPPQGGRPGFPPKPMSDINIGYLNMIPNYPVASQPQCAPPMNNSANDAIVQMIAMQTVASMAQQRPLGAPPPVTDSSFTGNSPGVSSNQTDPPSNISSDTANSSGAQDQGDTTDTNSGGDRTAGQVAAGNLDLNSLSTPPRVGTDGSIVVDNPGGDVAPVDPVFAQMHLGLTSPSLATDADLGATSPLAGLCPTSAAFDASAIGTSVDPTISPLSSLMRPTNTNEESPLAGLMLGHNATAAPECTETSDNVDMCLEETTVVDDSETMNEEQFADAQVDYVMDATACGEAWVAS